MRVTVCRRSSTGNRFRAGQGETVAILCGCEIPERGEFLHGPTRSACWMWANVRIIS